MRVISGEKLRDTAYKYSASRLADSQYEFELFRLKLAPEEFERCVENFERFKVLADAYVVTTQFSDEHRFQVNFQKRKLRNRGLEGEDIIEHGASLVYSIGPNGRIATMIYGARSDVASMMEQLIFLRVGFYTARQLESRMRRDIKNFVAYAYYSGLDTDPTFRERTRVWFLRRFYSTNVDDKFVPAKAGKWLGSFGVEMVKTVLSGLFKYIVLALLAVLLLWFGFDELAALISVTTTP